MERVWSPMTSSMITLVTSGTRAMTAMPAREAPRASTTSFGYRQAYPASRRAQPRCGLPLLRCHAGAFRVVLVCRKAPTRNEADFIPPQQIGAAREGCAQTPAVPRR